MLAWLGCLLTDEGCCVGCFILWQCGAYLFFRVSFDCVSVCRWLLFAWLLFRLICAFGHFCVMVLCYWFLVNSVGLLFGYLWWLWWFAVLCDYLSLDLVGWCASVLIGLLVCLPCGLFGAFGFGCGYASVG